MERYIFLAQSEHEDTINLILIIYNTDSFYTMFLVEFSKLTDKSD